MNKSDIIFNRRRFLKATLAVAVTGSVSSAMAQTGRSQWNDSFDIGTVGSNKVASNGPVLSADTVGYTLQAIAQYEQLVAAGGWPFVPPLGQGSLKFGASSPVISTLRRRLMVSGDLAQEVGLSPAFDTYVDAALRRFQARHGLPVDGTVGNVTLAALNVPAQERLKQLQMNWQRLEKIAKQTSREKRFVMVNIPAAQIEVVENSVVVQRHTAVVGKIDRQTPILDSKISQIILNPYWTVPKSIILKDIIPLMQQTPSYLTDNNIHLYRANGQEVQPSEVNWNTDEAVSLMFRQDPGKGNAMSSTKINFANAHAVYMHDTPQQTLFNSLMRFDSSGCVRVQNIRDFNQWILKNTKGWDRLRIESVINSRVNTPISVADPVPLHFVYISAWSNADGVVQFRDDIYRMDGIN